MAHLAVVTGAGSGIGAAVTTRFADSGFAVRAVDLRIPSRSDMVRARARADYVVADVAEEGDVVSLFRDLRSKRTTPQVVVHAAGVDDPVAKKRIADAAESSRPVEVTAAMEDRQWRRMISVHLDGTFHVLRESVRAMWDSGGSIVVVGSSAALDCPVGYPHYSAAKAGVHALCQSVAKEVAGRGIRVNVVAPGPTNTAMAKRTSSISQRSVVNGHHVDPAEAADIADSVFYLASASARNISGATLLSNGARFTR